MLKYSQSVYITALHSTAQHSTAQHSTAELVGCCGFSVTPRDSLHACRGTCEDVESRAISAMTTPLRHTASHLTAPHRTLPRHTTHYHATPHTTALRQAPRAAPRRAALHRTSPHRTAPHRPKAILWAYIQGKCLFCKEIPYYTRKSLIIEGAPLLYKERGSKRSISSRGAFVNSEAARLGRPAHAVSRRVPRGYIMLLVIRLSISTTTTTTTSATTTTTSATTTTTTTTTTAAAAATTTTTTIPIIIPLLLLIIVIIIVMLIIHAIIMVMTMMLAGGAVEVRHPSRARARWHRQASRPGPQTKHI